MQRCPKCGANNAYIGAFSVECATLDCENFSEKQLEIYAEEMNKLQEKLYSDTEKLLNKRSQNDTPTLTPTPKYVWDEDEDGPIDDDDRPTWPGIYHDVYGAVQTLRECDLILDIKILEHQPCEYITLNFHNTKKE